MAASDTDRSVRLVQLQLGGGHVRPSAVTKKCMGLCGNFHLLQIGPKRPNAPARLGVSFGQQGTNFGPTHFVGDGVVPLDDVHNFGPTQAHLAPTSAQLGSKMAHPFQSNFHPTLKLIHFWPKKPCSPCCVAVHPTLHPTLV